MTRCVFSCFPVDLPHSQVLVFIPGLLKVPGLIRVSDAQLLELHFCLSSRPSREVDIPRLVSFHL